MKKKLNTVFFGLFFLGSAVAEAYFIRTSSGDYISVIGIGVVLLISGYLLMDSVRSKLAEQGKSIKSYAEKIYQEESQRRSEQLTELINLQKATYTATKKNTASITAQLAQLEALLERVEGLEESHGKAMERLELLQKKSLEGQKNALNLEINYSKENTKQLMRVLREAGDQSETRELLHKIAEHIEKGTAELRNDLQNISITIPASVSNEESAMGVELDWDLEGSAWNSNADNSQPPKEEPEFEKLRPDDWGWKEKAVTERSSADIPIEVQPEDIMTEARIEDDTAEAEFEDVMIKAELEDAMAEAEFEDVMIKEQVEDDTAEAEFEDVMIKAQLEDDMAETEFENITAEVQLKDVMAGVQAEDATTGMQLEDIMAAAKPEGVMMDAWSENIVTDMPIGKSEPEFPAEASMLEAFTKNGWLQEEKTPDTIAPMQEEPISGADEITDEIAAAPAEQAPVSTPEIIPLYDDPNKTLSADEIARLFASLGR